MDQLDEWKCKLRKFADVRDWNQFHSPKNLSMALIVEAAELVEHFQWLSQEQSHSLSSEKREAVGHELADIQIYLIRIADRLNIDLHTAVENKLEINEAKYPADKVKGQHKKYTDYENDL